MSGHRPRGGSNLTRSQLNPFYGLVTKVSLWLFLLGVFGLLGGCAQISPEERNAMAQRLALKKGWTAQVLATQPYVLMSFGPPVTSSVDLVTVYLEGDGYAWVRGRYPSEDPTPLDPLALRLAMAQPSAAAVYLARPCQFLKVENGSQCTALSWTRERFSADVLAAMNQGLDLIKKRFNAKYFVLVGFSGGARVGLELAAQREDIKQLITVAGNMDPAAWTDLLGLQPLAISTNNLALIRATEHLPQVYLVGDQDVVVPSVLTERFVARFPANNQPELLVIEGNAHVCCWVEQWPELWPKVLKH